MLQLRIGLRCLDDLVGDLAQLVVIEIAAQQLHLHLQPAGIADPLNGRRRHHEELAVGQAGQLALQPLRDRQDIGALGLAALVPRLEHDKIDAGIGQVGEIVEHRKARNRDHLIDARRVEGELGRLVQRRRRAPERGAVGQLRGDHQITLVFIGDERGRQPRDPPDAQARQHQADQHHDPADAHHSADQAGIGVLHAVVDVVEAR